MKLFILTCFCLLQNVGLRISLSSWRGVCYCRQRLDIIMSMKMAWRIKEKCGPMPEKMPFSESRSNRSVSPQWRIRVMARIAVGLAVFSLISCGCVQRRLIVRSQPEGAFVKIDGQQIGYTPVSVPFTYYGTRDVQLEKDGFKTVKVQQRVRPPWYARFPISFFSENFSPREIRDERLLEFQMEPKTEVQENLLLDRANGLRGDVQRGTVTAPIQ
jgi:hypothetical protein